jgi:hypothetical protein
VAERLFQEKIMREVRHGGRNALIVDLLVPDVQAPAGSKVGQRSHVVTVVNTHLEAKSTTDCRRLEIQEILNLPLVKNKPNPVILGGDWNTFGGDGRPLTFLKVLASKFKPEAILQRVITRFVPFSNFAFTARDIGNKIRTFDDPTVRDIWFLLPNEEGKLFDFIKNYRFGDLAAFDHRPENDDGSKGDLDRTINGTGKNLANSNQRQLAKFALKFSLKFPFIHLDLEKGFRPTSALERDIQVLRYKIDWLFVRGYLTDPYAKDSGGYKDFRMSPAFPRTMIELRDSAVPRLADHAPISLDLPFLEPGAASFIDDSPPGDGMGDPAVSQSGDLVPSPTCLCYRTLTPDGVETGRVCPDGQGDYCTADSGETYSCSELDELDLCDAPVDYE